MSEVPMYGLLRREYMLPKVAESAVERIWNK